MLEKLRSSINEKLENFKEDYDRRKVLRKLGRKDKFENESERLDRDIILETKRAELRGLETEHRPKNGTQSQSAFSKFQDFATNFANNQKNKKSAFGNLGINLGGENGKIKKSHKRSRTRTRSGNKRGKKIR